MNKTLTINKKPMGYWTDANIRAEALKYLTRTDFQNGSRGAQKAAVKRGKTYLDDVCSHMAMVRKPWTNEELEKEAMFYSRRVDFQNGNENAYQAALKRGKEFLDRICSHMAPSATEAWTDEEIRLEAKKYSTRSEFAKESRGSWQAAWNRGAEYYEEICSHMPLPSNLAWTKEELTEEAKKYSTRGEFTEKSAGAYQAAARDLIFLDLICAHMEQFKHKIWNDEDLIEEAFSYKNRMDFRKKSSGAYQAAWNNGMEFLNKICSHMSFCGSNVEKELMLEIKKFFPDSKKYKTNKVYIEGKPHIKGFEIDIFIPSINKGVEFDGTYWHSFEKMRSSKGKKSWSDSDILSYHEIKDSYFLSQGIQILHIREENWDLDESGCIIQIEQFLGITGFMSESDEKVA